MAKLKKSITIMAPVEKVYIYVSNSKNLPAIWPSLIDIWDIKDLTDGRTTNCWAYKMAGIHFEGTTMIEYVEKESIKSTTEGGIRSIQLWTFVPINDVTRVTFEVEYNIPIPVLGKLAEAVIVKMNDHEGDIIMANLKSRMEA